MAVFFSLYHVSLAVSISEKAIYQHCYTRKKPLTPKRYQRHSSRAANQIRTGDLILTKDVLYLLSHSSLCRPKSIALVNRLIYYTLYVLICQDLFLIFYAPISLFTTPCSAAGLQYRNKYGFCLLSYTTELKIFILTIYAAVPQPPTRKCPSAGQRSIGISYLYVFSPFIIDTTEVMSAASTLLSSLQSAIFL